MPNRPEDWQHESDATPERHFEDESNGEAVGQNGHVRRGDEAEQRQRHEDPVDHEHYFTSKGYVFGCEIELLKLSFKNILIKIATGNFLKVETNTEHYFQT